MMHADVQNIRPVCFVSSHMIVATVVNIGIEEGSVMQVLATRSCVSLPRPTTSSDENFT